MGRLPIQSTGNAGGNPFTGHVGQFLIHELGRIGAAFADQTGIEPLLGDPLELAEEMQFGLFAGIAPFGIEQALGDDETAAWSGACHPDAPDSDQPPRR